MPPREVDHERESVGEAAEGLSAKGGRGAPPRWRGHQDRGAAADRRGEGPRQAEAGQGGLQGARHLGAEDGRGRGRGGGEGSEEGRGNAPEGFQASREGASRWEDEGQTPRQEGPRWQANPEGRRGSQDGS